MLANGTTITKYMKDHFNKEKHEVFLLLERKTDSVCPDTLNYNYYACGNPTDKLQGLAELIERVAKEMGLSFDDTVEVMKNVHMQDRTIIRSRYLKHINEEWGVLD